MSPVKAVTQYHCSIKPTSFRALHYLIIYRLRFCKMSANITLYVMGYFQAKHMVSKLDQYNAWSQLVLVMWKVRTPKNVSVTKHEDITKWHRKTGHHCYVLVWGSCDPHSDIVLRCGRDFTDKYEAFTRF